MRTGLYRAGTRAANAPSQKRTTDQRLQDLALAIVDDQVRRDADRGRVLLDAETNNKTTRMPHET